MPASIVQFTSVPAGKLSVTLRPVAVPAVLLLRVTVKPICDPALTVAASAVLVMATVAGGVGVGIGVGVSVGVGVGVGVSVGLGVGVGDGVPACSHVVITSLTKTELFRFTVMFQYAKLWNLPAGVATRSFLYLPLSGISAVDSVNPAEPSVCKRSL